MEKTGKTKESALVHLLDMIYVPSSVLRWTHKKHLAGELEPKPEYKDSKVAAVSAYGAATCLEAMRLCVYYELFNFVK
ncbi:hypothetical protein ACFLZZ_00195 [Nanoarchaeota archaeon]